MFMQTSVHRDIVRDLRKQLQTAENLNTGLLADREYARTTLAAANVSCEDDRNFEVDFGKLEVFSIERLPVNNVKKTGGKTAIGHLLDGKIHEWSLDCSLATHQRLVREWRAHRGLGERRTVLHVSVGTASWTPSSIELHGLTKLFENAIFAPSGAAVITRSGVSVDVDHVEVGSDVSVVTVKLQTWTEASFPS